MARTNLTGYAALLSESLSSRVGLLEKLLCNAHYPSLGQYKERLLADTIEASYHARWRWVQGLLCFPMKTPIRPVVQIYTIL